MNKPIIIYKSATGFTEKYAEWISAALGCEAIIMKKASPKLLAGYKTVIFGTRIHAGRIDRLDRARKLFSQIGAEKMILFVTGGTPSEATDVIDKLWQDNLTAQERKNVAHFYLPGGLCYEKMSMPDRMIMKMAAKMMSKSENQDPIQAGFSQALTGSYDISDKKYIAPLVEHIKSQNN